MGRRERAYEKVIVCSKCRTKGGTLLKEGDHYIHQDRVKCSILQLRRIKGNKSL